MDLNPLKMLIATGVEVEVLYGQADFQARLWKIEPGTKVEGFPWRQSSEPEQCQSQNLLMTGSVAIDGTLKPQIGQRFILSSETRCALENSGDAPAMMLELCWGQGFQPMPLKEVTENRPWGSFTVLKDEPDYKLKQLQVKPGNRLSLQRHARREEHWLVTRGKPEVTLDGEIHHLSAGDYIHIPLRSWHRITNPQTETADVEMVELQLGDYFGEDDIERCEDDYGRA